MMTGTKAICISILAGVLLASFPPAQSWSAEGASYLNRENKPRAAKQRSNAVKPKKVRKGRSAGLSGKLGHVRYSVMFSASMTGGCKALYHRYVKASGHSAYASTPMYQTETFHCAAQLNAGSQKAAENLALASCKRAKKRYKIPSGPCIVFMSK